MTRMIIAIDPGKIGGIVCAYKGGVQTDPMPDTLDDLRDHLESLIAAVPNSDVVVYVEDVGTYMPGNSGPSAVKFAEHVGSIRMALCFMRVRRVYVRPQKWIAAFIGKPAYPEKKADYDPKGWKAVLTRRKTERKNRIKAKSQREFPDTKVTLKVSDALGILWYGTREEESRLF